MLKDKNIYVKEDMIKKKKSKKEAIIEEKLNEILPKKKIFKHENPLKKLKEVYSDEV